MIWNMTDYLERAAERFPERVAVVDSTREILYDRLRMQVRKMAWALISRGLFRRPVVMYLDKGVTAVEAIWGIVYSGCYYTPLDIHMPLSRAGRIVETLEPALILTDEAHLEAAREIGGNREILTVEAMQGLDVDDAAVERHRRQIIDTDLLYVFFTSGSTGIPKGVMISHRAVMDFTEAAVETFGMTEEERIGNQGALHFDLSTLDVYGSVAAGAALYLIPPKYFKFPVKLLQYIAEHRISMIYWVPSALVVTANLRALQVVDVHCLKKITFCGEVMPCKQLNVWRKYVPDALYANLYGPTETTCASTYYIVEREFGEGDMLPIGKPFRNTRIRLVTEEGREAQPGEMGEICIGGSSLAYGYYQDEIRTRESFVTYEDGGYKEIWYHTGDLARYNERGELLYLSRKDFQIKHMGHRIELGEIETALNAIEEIGQCCCLYDEEKHKIVAFLETELEEDKIRERLALVIPDYMQPDRYRFVKDMPHNANGKIDRAALRKEV